ncbi:MAG: potassium transporter TrkA [Thermoplasmata archaeon]|nr:MAG: potassium transporter TrkA [Thermoplasmata archaeon]
MIALISLLIVILFSITIVRIGAVALEMTGLSKEMATFQAQSAFSGTGFTTSESEFVVSHPVRRKIVKILIFLGSAGIASAMATLVLTFIGQGREEATARLLWLFVGLLTIYLFARSKMIDKGMRYLIKKALEKFTNLKVYDYEQLLGLSKGYSIGEFKVKEGSWLENKKLRELRVDEEGILILGIYRRIEEEEQFIGAPDGDTEIMKGDTLICYGPEEAIKNLSQRLRGRAGDEQHEKAVEEERIRKEQERELGGRLLRKYDINHLPEK